MSIKNKKLILTAILVIATTSTACYFPQIISSEDMVATEVEKAVDEILEQTAEAATEAIPTYTPYPTYTPAPTYTPQAAFVSPYYYDNRYHPSDSQVHSTSYCNKSVFLGETIADNTVFRSGDTFTKTWTFMNIGYCTWTTDYRLVFTSGNSMGGDVVSRLSSSVPPGGIVQLTVDLTAPYRSGTYKGNWAIETDNGYRFSNFWVQIKVR